MLEPILLAWTIQCCTINNVEPAFVLAVMKMESNFKCGPLGKKGTYVGPGGLHKDFRTEWNIDDPKENIRVTVASLKNTQSKEAKVKRLKRYNKTWWKGEYIPSVLKQYSYYKRRF